MTIKNLTEILKNNSATDNKIQSCEAFRVFRIGIDTSIYQRANYAVLMKEFVNKMADPLEPIEK